jgi:hypothetical protein
MRLAKDKSSSIPGTGIADEKVMYEAARSRKQRRKSIMNE